MKKLLFLVLLISFISCKTAKDSTAVVPSDKKIEIAVDLGNIKIDVETLSDDKMEGREVGTPGEKMAAEYIASRMKAIGLSPKGTKDYYQYFVKKNSTNPHGEVNDGDPSIKGTNVVGYIDNGAKQTVVIGAHYDHLGYGGFGSLYVGPPAIHNGADDNASGVAGMLHIAEALKMQQYHNNNYMFIAFSGEEKGLWGSNYFAKHPTIGKEGINYMINMDMIGRLGDERKLLMYGSGTSPVWQEVLPSDKDHTFAIKDDPSGMGPTDHTSFYLEDIPVLSFFTGQHSDYHKPTDDAHLINYVGINEITDFILKVINATQSKGKLPFTKTKDASQEKMSFKVTLGVMPDYLYDGEGMKMDGVKEDRPAGNAGMIKGDVVVKMGDLPIKDMQDYMKALGKFEPGQTVPVTILRKGKAMVLPVTF